MLSCGQDFHPLGCWRPRKLTLSAITSKHSENKADSIVVDKNRVRTVAIRLQHATQAGLTSDGGGLAGARLTTWLCLGRFHVFLGPPLPWGVPGEGPDYNVPHDIEGSGPIPLRAPNVCLFRPLITPIMSRLRAE
jgi:hypothetical protein